MPSIKSHRVSERRRKSLSPLRSRAKTFVTKARLVMGSEDMVEAEDAVKDAVAAQKGAIHKRNASRRKSRLMKRLHLSRSKIGVDNS